MTHLGEFTVSSVDGELVFRAELGPDGATPTDGYGGWGVTARPKKVGLSEWGGRNPYAFDLDWLIDNYEEGDGAGTERAVWILEQMAGLGDDDEPPTLIVDASGAIPHDYTRSPGNRWIIENLGWDKKYEIRNDNGRLIRVRGTISFRKHTFDQALGAYTAAERSRRKAASKRKAGQRGSAGSRRKKSYTVKKGDTLAKIAASRLGKSSRWREIAELNGISDPRKLVVGQKLKMP
jgi:hypothetical protein